MSPRMKPPRRPVPGESRAEMPEQRIGDILPLVLMRYGIAAGETSQEVSSDWPRMLAGCH